LFKNSNFRAIQILLKYLNFVQKSEFCSKIQILFKKSKVCKKKIKFYSNIQMFFKKSKFVQKYCILNTTLKINRKNRLMKIEEGLGGGAVLYHQYKTKTEEEMMKLEEKKTLQSEQKEERKRVQNENVTKKEKAKADEKKKQAKVIYTFFVKYFL